MIKTTVEGDCMVFRKDFDGRATYSTTLSKKNIDGEWENGYIPIQFKKGVELANKTRITITNGWLSFYKTKDNKTVPYIFCLEFDGGEIPDGFQALDEDIPF